MRSRDLPGVRTDRLIMPTTTEVRERPDCLVLRTESRPQFWLGNFMVPDEAPEPADIAGWFDRFADEYRDLSVLKQMLLWESEVSAPAPDLSELPEGAEHAEEVVMTAHIPPPEPNAPGAYDFRKLDLEKDWSQFLDYNQRVYTGWVADWDDMPARAISDLAEVVKWRVAEYRKTMLASSGSWWSAWHGDEIVGSLAIYQTDDLLRFREPVTARERGGQGICTTLAALALRDAFDRHPNATAVVVPQERESRAYRIYRGLGYEPVSVQHTVIRDAP